MKFIQCLAVAVCVSFAASFVPVNSSVRIERTTNSDGWTIVSEWYGDEWLGEREYRADGTLRQHRYWDWMHRLHAVHFSEDGSDAIDHEITE